MPLLEFRCSLRYPSGVVIEPSFATDAPVTALFGPSGSGKTSILSMIAGLRRPDRGTIKLGSRVLFDSDKAVDLSPDARRIGYVFQDGLLFPHMDVRHNLLYGHKRHAAGKGRVDFDEVVKTLELADLLGRKPHTLSGGQQQRVALGRALLCDPDLLLLDEPLSSIDDPLKQRVLDYIEQALQHWRIPTLYVTHDPDEARRIAGWVVCLNHGRVAGAGEAKGTLG